MVYGEGVIASTSPLSEGDGLVRCSLLVGRAMALGLAGYRNIPKEFSWGPAGYDFPDITSR